MFLLFTERHILPPVIVSALTPRPGMGRAQFVMFRCRPFLMSAHMQPLHSYEAQHRNHRYTYKPRPVGSMLLLHGLGTTHMPCRGVKVNTGVMRAPEVRVLRASPAIQPASQAMSRHGEKAGSKGKAPVSLACQAGYRQHQTPAPLPRLFLPSFLLFFPARARLLQRLIQACHGKREGPRHGMPAKAC